MKNKIGLSFAPLFFLALLGVPRVIAHDLQWVTPESLANKLLVFIPPMIWIGFVLWKKVAKPFTALFLIGVIYGLLLAITHQLLWNEVFVTLPVLGGKLSGLPSITVEILARSFAFMSSLVTGAFIGVIVGVIGSVLNRVRT